MSLRALGRTVATALLGEEGEARQSSPLSSRRLAPYRLVRDEGGFAVDVELPPQASPRWRGAGKGPVARIGPFSTEVVAIEAAQNFAPVLWEDAENVRRCGLCLHGFAVLRRKHHCRNCGKCVCDKCCATWPTGALPETYAIVDARGFCRAAANFAAGLGDREAPRELSINWKDATPTRVCVACDDAAADFRRRILEGVDASTARVLHERGPWQNLNLWRPLPGGFGAGGLLPVQLAVASGSLPLVQWLVLERCCPTRGPFGLSAGDPPKTLLRVAVEHEALDILRWLLCCEPLESHGLPLSMPNDTGCNAAVVHRALEAALRDAAQLQNLLDQVLVDAQTEVQRTALAALVAERATNRRPSAPPVELDDLDHLGDGPSRGAPKTECVVCFADLDTNATCALVPCGHSCVCLQCGGSLSACPVCRARVEQVMRLFAS